jgi:glycosyltransferase involved in cell wall biosynthesis
MNPPKISIITPAYNMLSYLKACTCSVHDQGVPYEHIVIDGGSTDNTQDWLKESKNIRWISGKDNGMYDALNKGLAMAHGEIIGHLNADEQYLIGTLDKVIRFFDEHPEVDYITGDYLMVDKHGELIAYRKSFPAFWPFFFSNYLYTFTCTLFYRKKVVEKLRYNDRLKAIADVDFLYNIQRQKFKGHHIKSFMATFTYTGANLSMLQNTVAERNMYEKKMLPPWFNLFRFVFKISFYGARLLYGTLWQKGPLTYDIYTAAVPAKRKKIQVNSPSWKLPENIKRPKNS